jgi:hypothetical protein
MLYTALFPNISHFVGDAMLFSYLLYIYCFFLKKKKKELIQILVETVSLILYDNCGIKM